MVFPAFDGVVEQLSLRLRRVLSDQLTSGFHVRFKMQPIYHTKRNLHAFPALHALVTQALLVPTDTVR